MSTPENSLKSPLEAILGTSPVALVWIHPESAYAYVGLGDFDKDDAAEALRELAASLTEGALASSAPAVEPTGDFAAVMAGIHTLAVSSPAAVGETTDYQRGWDEAMAAVAAVAGTFEPTFAYQANDGHTGPIDILASQAPDLQRNGYTVRRRAVGPWEPHLKGAAI